MASMLWGYVVDEVSSRVFIVILHLSINSKANQTDEDRWSLRSWLQPPTFAWLLLIVIANVCLADIVIFISLCSDIVFAQFLWSTIFIGLLRFPIMPAFCSVMVT